MDKLKILILIRKFADKYPKQRFLFDLIPAIQDLADIEYWHEDGDIREILEKIRFEPDFIFQYDIGWGFIYAPHITGLGEIEIPKGCYVNDVHNPREERIACFEDGKVDLIFSTYREPFFKAFPEHQDKHRWLPFSINPDVMKDWGLRKNINFLLMGQVHVDDKNDPPKRNPPKGRYPFREAVLERMKEEGRFVFHPHPGHYALPSKNLVVNAKYAKELNRSKIFFTCGGEFNYAVAKFFEAPACRTLLLAKPNQDILDLGFIDGIHFVACDESNFYDKAMYYIKNKEERKYIIENGYDFIHTYHTNQVRARQFVNYVEDFLKECNTSKKIL
ncbi:glycosyltransferase [Petroclostridium sp. X23]|uniref:glycosyltransferase family protein n=1 Tax=Petroclostridium sp. X23 TaxID=3045146 RepID=UPI0024ACA9A6|nr:glycosyltransferase [Petroclostridium sp. X23]WHH58353.1 glycosyltransferase [Petroclostridium sp. X23]